MLGELLYEGKGRVTGSRISNADEYKIEYAITKDGKCKDIETRAIVVFSTKTVDKKVVYGERQAIINTKDGEDTATWKSYGIGHSKGQVSASFRGSVFYKSSSISTNVKLVFLNNKVEVFEYEADKNGNINGKIWEWK
jgi:hypothetical protein